ncbi:hypothetical protein ACFX1T_008730 [Malus domestica]
MLPRRPQELPEMDCYLISGKLRINQS